MVENNIPLVKLIKSIIQQNNMHSKTMIYNAFIFRSVFQYLKVINIIQRTYLQIVFPTLKCNRFLLIKPRYTLYKLMILNN